MSLFLLFFSEKLEGEAAAAEFLVEGGNLSKSDTAQSSNTAPDAATPSSPSQSSSVAPAATISKSPVAAVHSPLTSPSKQQQQTSPAAVSPGATSAASPKPVAVVVPSSQEQPARGRKRAFDAAAGVASEENGTEGQSAPAAKPRAPPPACRSQQLTSPTMSCSCSTNDTFHTRKLVFNTDCKTPIPYSCRFMSVKFCITSFNIDPAKGSDRISQFFDKQ